MKIVHGKNLQNLRSIPNNPQSAMFAGELMTNIIDVLVVALKRLQENLHFAKKRKKMNLLAEQVMNMTYPTIIF